LQHLESKPGLLATIIFRHLQPVNAPLIGLFKTYTTGTHHSKETLGIKIPI
jgi:hypothetical protein